MRFAELLLEDVTKINSPEFNAMLTPEIRQLDSAFRKAGYEIRIVGGAVRDLLLGRSPKDIDFATNATPQEMIEVFKANNIKYVETGLAHGTISAIINHTPFEITTLRVDVETTGRHAKVAFTRDFEKDAERRDLTINAMSLDLQGNLYDYFNGRKDLQQGVIRFVGEASLRIREDYLRILRYFRFLGRFHRAEIPEGTREAIAENASGLKQISGERIWSELQQILKLQNTVTILKEMCELGVAQYCDIPCDRIEAVARVQKFTQNPVTLFASMLNTENEVESVRNHQKWANPERDLASFLVQHKSKPLTLELAENMLTNGVRLDWVIELANLQEKGAISSGIKHWVPPKFPITGNDLLKIGYKAGPEVGAELARLKQLWQQGRFKLSRDQLLAQIKQ